MLCPNCQNKLETIKLDNIVVDHCPNCGGTFFDENEINRISIKHARYLSRLKRAESISGKQKLCPRDNKPLKNLISKSKPQYVTLLQCDICHGIFAYADDLLHFKKAQDAKINYFKQWNIPFPQLKTVLVYSLATLVGFTMYYATTYTQKAQLSNVKADELIQNIETIQNNQETIICFTTKQKLYSKIILRDIDTGEEIERSINQNSMENLHCKSLSSDEAPPEKNIMYRIVLTSGSGQSIEGEFTNLGN